MAVYERANTKVERTTFNRLDNTNGDGTILIGFPSRTSLPPLDPSRDDVIDRDVMFRSSSTCRPEPRTLVARRHTRYLFKGVRAIFAGACSLSKVVNTDETGSARPETVAKMQPNLNKL